jgi:hypothetical protein
MGTYIVTFVFFAGTDVETAITTGGTAAGFGIDDLTFNWEDFGPHTNEVQPELLFVYSSHGLAGDEYDGMEHSFGIATGTGSTVTTQKCLAWTIPDNDASNNTSEIGIYNGKVLVHRDTANYYDMTVSSMDAGGGTDKGGVTWTYTGTPPATDEAYAFGVNLSGNYKVWTDIIDSATTIEDKKYTIGFTPQFVGLFPTFITTEDSTRTTSEETVTSGFSAIDKNSEICSSFHHEYNAATTNAGTKTTDKAIVLHKADGTDGLTATKSSFANGQIGLNYTTVDATARKILAFAIEGETVPSRLISYAGTNGDCELAPVTNGWTELTGGANWQLRSSNPLGQGGSGNYFTAGAVAASDTPYEIYQDIDVTAYSNYIEEKSIKFTFSGWITDFNTDDTSHIIVEYRNSGGTVLTSYNTGQSYPTEATTGTSTWDNYTDTIIPPPTTATVRIRLISTRYGGTNSDGYFDNLSLIADNIVYPYSPALVPTLHGADVINQVTYYNNYEYDGINHFNTHARASESINAKMLEGWSIPQEFYLTRTDSTLWDYVPQGFYAQADGTCWISMPAYNESGCSGAYASLAVKFNTTNNQIEAVYHLRNTTNTVDQQCHNGGLVYTTGSGTTDGYLIISHDDILYHYNLDDAVLVNDGGIEYTLPEETRITVTYPASSPNTRVSATGLANDFAGNPYLWATEFSSTNGMWILGYPIDATGRVSQTTSDYGFPCNANILDQVQGLQVIATSATTYTFLLSTASSGDDSELVEVTFTEHGTTGFLPSQTATSGTAKFYGPRGLEGVTVYGTTAWTVNESGCRKWINNTTWDYSFPYIMKIDIS